MKAGLKDARLRGNFNKWLNKQAIQRFAGPGMDPNRAMQFLNAAGGNQNVGKRPPQGPGQQAQNFYRNRANEQPGLPTPTPPASASPPVGPRRY